jgi:hypothetical protein
MSRINLLLAGLLLIASLPEALNAQDASPDAKAMIKDALSATTAEMAKGATVVDWENNVLKEGDNGWTCFPTPPEIDTGPMSNSDPYATEETDDWVVVGAHLMIIVPDASMLEGIPTDPKNGGPWVMWKGTPYAHVMVPVD